MAADWNGVAAAVLAGGLGTRLRAAVPDRPKVLAEVNGRPFLAHLLDRLAAAGARDATLLVGYAADRVRAAFGDRHGPLRLAYSREPEPLGTGGAVRLGLPHLRGESVLLLNGDSFCDVDLAALLAFHRTHPPGATLTLTRVPDAGRYGRVRLDGYRVTDFEEKNPHAGPGWINAGVYLFARELVEAIPAGRAVSLEGDCLPAWVAAGRVWGFAGGGRFIDIGTPESYAAAAAFFDVREPVPAAGRRR
jgi:NDP-sugar pyrophosphorylase family protein